VYSGFCEAFDLIVHDVLIKKLALYNINRAHIKRIKNWLTDRSQKVVVNGESSSNDDVQHFHPQSGSKYEISADKFWADKDPWGGGNAGKGGPRGLLGG